jgi:ribosomal-protein-alanine N-acetyltransferase
MAMWSDPEFAQAAGIEATTDLDALMRSLAHFAHLNKHGLYYKWTIRRLDDNAFLGEAELYPLKPQTDPWLEWGLGYSMAREHWGRGLMREALERVLRFALIESQALRIRADVGAQNGRSKALLSKLGFRCEGIQESKNFLYGRAVDMELWAISRVRYQLQCAKPSA